MRGSTIATHKFLTNFSVKLSGLSVFQLLTDPKERPSELGIIEVVAPDSEHDLRGTLAAPRVFTTLLLLCFGGLSLACE